MTVVLRRRELVGRRERPLDRANVEQPPIRRRIPSNVVGDIGELDDGFALRERRQHPFGDTEHAEPGGREAALQNFPPRALIRHMHCLRHQAAVDSNANRFGHR